MDLLSVNTTFFTIFDYQMSYIEFFGTLLNLLCVYLIVKKNVWNWPIGIVGALAFGSLFYQLRLYADFTEQIYFFVTGFVGWYAWNKRKGPKDIITEVVVGKDYQNLFLLSAISACTVAGSYVMFNIDDWLPTLFPAPATFVILDVLTTVMSFAAQWLMIKRRVENWILWITVDVIAIGLYWKKGIPFVSGLYVIFLGLAIAGLVEWVKTLKEQNVRLRTSDREILSTTSGS